MISEAFSMKLGWFKVNYIKQPDVVTHVVIALTKVKYNNYCFLNCH